MPKKERVRSQRSKGSWPFKSQEAAGVHRSRMICWSSFLDVLDFTKKNSEALNWGDYQMISRWTGVTFVEEAGLNHLRSATVTKHPISPWVPEIWALSDHFLEELTIDSFILDWSGTFLHPFPNIFRRISFHPGTRTERWSKAAICWTRWGVGWMDSSNSNSWRWISLEINTANNHFFSSWLIQCYLSFFGGWNSQMPLVGAERGASMKLKASSIYFPVYSHSRPRVLTWWCMG